MGELNVEKQRITWRKFREMGSRNYSSSIVANSRSSLYLRNMVELVVDFTGSGILKQSKYLDIGEYSSGPYEHLVD